MGGYENIMVLHKKLLENLFLFNALFCDDIILYIRCTLYTKILTRKLFWVQNEFMLY